LVKNDLFVLIDEFPKEISKKKYDDNPKKHHNVLILI
tara:strand:+ start:1911 stop:2021 length:111 start_codon:yes stop_codon:yes gene_type:complete